MAIHPYGRCCPDKAAIRVLAVRRCSIPESVTLIGYQIGTYPAGVEGRGYCHGPGNVNTDFSVDKNWRVWGERMRIQFRMDFFNLFNHPNFRGDQVNGVGWNGSNTTFQNVNCGAADAAGLYQPCSLTNNVITQTDVQRRAKDRRRP